MKKQLLFGLSLLTTLSNYAQHDRSMAQPAGHINMAEIKMNTFAIDENSPTTYNKERSKEIDKMNEKEVANTKLSSKTTMPPTQITWSLVCGSMNCYGQIVSNSRPLQYHPDLKVVSIVHRKSNTYNPTPAVPVGSESGVIVAEISGNWGTTWDSTCMYAGSADAGRYPQGAIYNPPTNTNIANAYIVGGGPTVNGNNFTGDWYASKKLAAAGSTVYNTTADVTPNAQQFLSFGLPSYPAGQCRHGWSRYGFSTTLDGNVRSLALIQNDQTTLGNAALMRGCAVVKGTFNAGVFNWTTDSLIPNTVVTSGGVKVVSSNVQMAWNDSGTVGYAVMLGALSNAVLSNRGYQPIIFKYQGSSWSQLPNGINFNSPSMNVVTDHLAGVVSGIDTIAVPYFNDFDLAVDSAGYLHIGATVCSGAIAHDDSLNFIAQYTLSTSGPNKKYLWGHRKGLRPYIYDFVGNGNAPWKVITVDSMSSEDPGSATTASGYPENLWDPTGPSSAKINNESRLQLGRTKDGRYISFSWSESDTNFTQNSVKYNVLPNIKSRILHAAKTPTDYVVSSTEINISKPLPTQGPTNPQIASRATLHYMSPVTSDATITAVGLLTHTVELRIPFTVTNSNPWSQLTNNATWFTAAYLQHVVGNVPVSLKESVAKDEVKAELFPNPASNKVSLAFNISENLKMDLNVISVLGHVVKNYSIHANSGLNTADIDITDLKTGVYFVNLRSGNTQITKKLIVE
jgi:hypothetical protein